jgi:hypothetical protein
VKDYGLRPDARLSPADRAVKYALDRVQHDADLAYHAGFGTELFAVLCEAEAARLGGGDPGPYRDEVEDRRSVDCRAPGDRRPAEVVRLRERLDRLLEAARLAANYSTDPRIVTALRGAIADAEGGGA